MICHACGLYDLALPKWFHWDGETWRVKCELCLFWRVRAYADGCADMGVGMLLGEERGFRRIKSGLPAWLQNLGGPKQLLRALDRRSGPLFTTIRDLAWENGP